MAYKRWFIADRKQVACTFFFRMKYKVTFHKQFLLVLEENLYGMFISLLIKEVPTLIIFDLSLSSNPHFFHEYDLFLDCFIIFLNFKIILNMTVPLVLKTNSRDTDSFIL